MKDAGADTQLAEVEQTRDLSQVIVHVDMDAFVSAQLEACGLVTSSSQYASVEVQRDPSLKGKAFGVGRGVLTTASVSRTRPS
jgi:DNA polymerase kappa